MIEAGNLLCGLGSSVLLPPFVGTRDDMVQGGYYDVDGNGLADVYVAANPVHPTDSTKVGSAAPYWRRNTLAAPQGRLTAIVGPHGGRTELTWTVVNEGGVNGARILPAIGSIADADGRTDFKFTSPAFDAGRFIGFEHAQASGTSGVAQSTQFATDRARQGAVDYEAVTNEKGFLHHLIVHLDRQSAHKVALDEIAPYFNPVYRTCSFETGHPAVERADHVCCRFLVHAGNRRLGDVERRVGGFVHHGRFVPSADHRRREDRVGRSIVLGAYPRREGVGHGHVDLVLLDRARDVAEGPAVDREIGPVERNGKPDSRRLIAAEDPKNVVTCCHARLPCCDHTDRQR
jgi:hypothetical protein